MRLVRIAVGGFVLAAAITGVAAQSGGLKIRVYDAADQAPLPGSLVTLSHATGNVKTTTEVADDSGVVVFPVLRPGPGYVVEVSFPGYATVRADARVKISETAEVPVGLSPEFREEIKIVAKRPVVDLEKSETTTKFTDEFIQDLPVQGRFYQNVLTLAPGVQDNDGDGNPNVLGARSRDFKTMVSGVSNVDPLTGQWLSYVNPDSIEEIEVVTAGAGVEYGRAQGGFANIIQKQGGNDFEGVFSFLYRSSKLDGRGATTLTGRRFPSFETLQPAFQVSGPIVKDKLWYIFSHEYQDQEIPVNTLKDLVVTTRKQTIAADRITWQASPRNKLSMQYQFDPLTLENFGVSSQVPASASQRIEYGGPTYTLAWTAPYSTNLLVDSLVAYQDIHSNILPMTTGFANDCIVGFEAIESAQCFNLETGAVSGSYFQTWRDQRQRFTVKTQAELYGGRFWGMNHQFKFGFIVENERYFRELERRPITNFFILQNQNEGGDTGTGDVDQVGIVAGQFFVPTYSESRATGTTWGIYGEDQMKPLNNLTIRVGLRLERETIRSKGVLPFDPAAESAAYLQAIEDGVPSSQALLEEFTAFESLNDFGQQLGDALGIPIVTTNFVGIARSSFDWYQTRRFGDISLTNTNLSPFLAVSWDPWSDSKTKFAFTVGRHYNNIPLIVPNVELLPASAFLNLRASRNPLTDKWTVDELTDGINPAANVSIVDRNLKTPYQDEWTVTMERELTAETAIRLTYVNRKFRDQIQDVDLNHAAGDYGKCVLQLRPQDPTIVVLQPGDAGYDPDRQASLNGQGGFFGTGGDGLLDDCIGEFEVAPVEDGGDDNGGHTGPAGRRTVQRPDGFLDTYVLNPGWGGVYFVSNSNTADFKGVILELERRLYRSWEMNASYTWSKAVGDAEDFFQDLGDDQTTLDDERGFLSYDQRHVVKINATTITPWGFRLGGTVTWESGLPYSLLTRQLSLDALAPQLNGFGDAASRVRLRYKTGQRNDQRNHSYWTFNLKFTKEMQLAKGRNLQLTAEMFNLLNDDALTIDRQVNGNNDSIRRFGRRYQVGFRLAF